MDGKTQNAYNVLERILVDENEKPARLPLSLLQAITNNFSDERIIGIGGFAVVYKGIMDGIGSSVAVKKLSSLIDLDGFEKEVHCLMKVRHKNIVRFLGYCGDTQKEVAEYGSKPVLADVRNLALCFEFVPNGSLGKFIKDASCGWTECYEMIKGICGGLHYLHQNNIAHLDLKPANILVDDKKMPKLADFGLSRRFEVGQSKIVTQTVAGTIGYLAPESINSGIFSLKSDIYSLGVVIMEILTGKSVFSTQEEVVESWRNRAEISQKDVHQIRACAEEAAKCMQLNPASRPTTNDIMTLLGFNNEDNLQLCTSFYGGKFLKVPTLKLHFHLDHSDKSNSYPLYLVNITDDYVAFRLLTTKQNLRNSFRGPLCGVVPPKSRYILAVTMCSQVELPMGKNGCFFLESSIEVHQRQLEYWKQKQKSSEGWAKKLGRYDELLKELEEKKSKHFLPYLYDQFTSAKQMGLEVHRLKLTTAYMPPGPEETTSSMVKLTITPLVCEWIDVHPTQPWMLTVHSDGSVYLRNFETQEIKNSIQVPATEGRAITAAFIPRKEWFVVLNYDNLMVYDINETRKLFTRVSYGSAYRLRITVHQTKPYVLVTDSSGIYVWNWEQDWSCIWWWTKASSNDYKPPHAVKFIPYSTSFFTAQDVLKIGDVGRRPLPNEHEMFGSPLCLDCYVTGEYDELYLITGYEDKTAKVWEYQTRSCVQILEGHLGPVTAVSYHSDIPILITGSSDGTVRLWNTITFRDPRILDCGLGRVTHIYCIKGSRRIVIMHQDGLALVDIDQ